MGAAGRAGRWRLPGGVLTALRAVYLGIVAAGDAAGHWGWLPTKVGLLWRSEATGAEPEVMLGARAMRTTDTVFTKNPVQ